MYRILHPIRFFDITLREGLQTITHAHTLSEKQIIMRNIVNKYKPSDMEIGKICSTKPDKHTNDSLKLYKYSQIIGGCNFYLYVEPSISLLKYANDNNIRNISLTTSTSNIFQCITQLNSVDSTYTNIEQSLSGHTQFERIKLNISCINKCPVENKLIDHTKIVDEISRYCRFGKIKEFCLVDTCGTLEYDEFQDIIDEILPVTGPGRLSLRLYVSNRRKTELNRIISAAMFRGIYKFDVCSSLQTAEKNDVNIHQNIIYEDVTNNFLPLWKN